MTAFNHAISEVECVNGMRIECRYLMSPNYSPTSNVCLCLHWLFLLYSPSRTHPSGYLLRSGIEHFLDYLALHNQKNPKPLHILKYTDINTEIFTGFINYLHDNKINLACAEKLKTAMTAVAKETGKLPLIALPIVPVQKSNGSQPLSSEGFESFQLALTQHITVLWKKLKFRAEVEKAEPYTALAIMEEVRPTPTKENLFQWQKFLLSKGGKSKTEVYLSRFQNSPDEEIRALANDADGVKKFRKIYQRDIDKFNCDGSFDPFSTGGFANWKIDYARAVKTFIAYGFPFKYDMDDLYNNYRQKHLVSIPEDCDDVIKIIMHRLTGANRSSSQERTLPVDEVFSLYYADTLDMTAILLFMMFQSGWNKETALALDQDNHEHILSETIEAAIKVVFAEKNKSQGLGKPFESPKRISIPTRDDDPYSLYNLIRLSRMLSEPLTEFEFDHIPVVSSDERMNPLFLCIRPWAEWKKGGRHTSIANPKTFQVGVQFFLRQYEVIDDGKRLTMAAELTRRLRPTWLLYKKKHNPISLLSMAMAHADRDTTDIFYDNSSAAHQERMKRLRSELEEVINLLRTRQFKGLLGKQAQADASAKLKIFHIPGKSRALWGCADQTKPDWVGSAIIATTGQKCFAIKECIFCSQLRVFEDSLPFLMERESHLDELLADSSDMGFKSRIAKEREALQFIIDEWGDEDEVAAAARYRRRESPLLPRDLSILEIIFESEDENV